MEISSLLKQNSELHKELWSDERLRSKFRNKLVDIAQKFYDGAKYLGVALTLGMTRWSLTAKYWNSVIEPYFVDLVDNTINNAGQGFVDGLRSDNKK